MSDQVTRRKPPMNHEAMDKLLAAVGKYVEVKWEQPDGTSITARGMLKSVDPFKEVRVVNMDFFEAVMLQGVPVKLSGKGLARTIQFLDTTESISSIVVHESIEGVGETNNELFRNPHIRNDSFKWAATDLENWEEMLRQSLGPNGVELMRQIQAASDVSASRRGHKPQNTGDQQ